MVPVDSVDTSFSFSAIRNQWEKLALCNDLNMAAKDSAISGVSEDAMMFILDDIDANLPQDGESGREDANRGVC
jgi:hypothetical protein